MRKTMSLFGVAVLAASVATTSFADESKFGLSKTLVTTSLVKKIDKNVGLLRVSLSTSCHDSKADAKHSLLDAKVELVAAAEQELARLKVEGVVLDEQSEKVSEYPNAKYSLRYPTQESTVMAFIEQCTNKQYSLRDLSIEEMNKMKEEDTYGASLALTFVSKSQIAKLMELKQFLADVISEQNKAEKASKLSKAVTAQVSNPSFVIDEETQAQLKEELSSKLGLESQETQISVDEAFLKRYTGKGFAEKYVNTNDDAQLSYTSTYPQLQEEDGKVKLQKDFFFTVSYLPSNLGSDKAAKPGVQKKDFSIATEMKLEESDVESYRASIRVQTRCHSSREAANQAFKSAFNKAKAAAEAVLSESKGKPEANVVRFAGVSSPTESYDDAVVGRRPRVEKDSKRTRWDSNLWLDNCSGSVTGQELRKKYWSASQSFEVLTDKFATYQEVKKLAKESVGAPAVKASYLEKNRYPVVVSRNQDVVLKDENWRKAVDAELYEQALYKLTDPQGEVAKHLSSPYIQASVAYYSLGVESSSHFFDGRESFARSGDRMEAAPAKSYDGGRIIVDDSNLAPHVERAAKSYTITWRPEADLTELIEARAKMQSPDYLP